MATTDYTSSRIDYLSKYLQSLLPGLDYNVAKTWITSEKGANGNVLGTTFTSGGKQQLYQYPTQEAGLQAAASWINTRSIYSGIKNSLSGSASQQASAIASSPWNSSYYPRVFTNLISSTGSSVPSGGASTPLTPSYKDLVNQAFPNGLSINGTPVTANGATTTPLIDLKTPFYFLGVILVGVALIGVGGLVLLKGKAPV